MTRQSILLTVLFSLTAFSTVSAQGRAQSASDYVNLSQLQYIAAAPTDLPAEPYEIDEPRSNTLRAPAVSAQPSPAARPAVVAAQPARPSAVVVTAGAEASGIRWNTEAGRAALENRVVLTGEAAAAPSRSQGTPQRATACVQPMVTKSGSECCNYEQPDQLNGGDAWYRQPTEVFGGEQSAREFAATVRASLPMFQPHRDPDVRTSHGWIYNGSDERFHGAADYSKRGEATGPGIDPAFEVRSIASGVVVAVFWDDWSGNIVTVEHTAPNGDRYRSNYKHLRNGFDNDLAKARGLTTVPSNSRFDKDGNATNRYKYELFAYSADPSEKHWGTNEQKITVKLGDRVRAGEVIGWSGNTGPGGAGNGLNDDGTPKNENTANNHLHLMIAVPDPTRSGNDWVQVDPFGVYNQVAESGCYELLDTSAYVRLFAPFYPSFHNVPVELVGFYWGYYTGMEMGLKTISTHRRGGDLLASGSFQRGLPAAWYARLYMTGDGYQAWYDTYKAQGFRPRLITVSIDGGGNPRYSVIWAKRQGEAVAAYHGLSDAQWDEKWQQHVVEGDMRVETRAAYRAGNDRRLAVVFVKDEGGSGFYEYHYMNGSSYQERYDELGSQGWRLVDAEAEELADGVFFGGIWRKASGAWATRHGLTPSQYQTAHQEMSANGFRLERVQGYDDSRRFIAVWHKP